MSTHLPPTTLAPTHPASQLMNVINQSNVRYNKRETATPLSVVKRQETKEYKARDVRDTVR